MHSLSPTRIVLALSALVLAYLFTVLPLHEADDMQATPLLLKHFTRVLPTSLQLRARAVQNALVAPLPAQTKPSFSRNFSSTMAGYDSLTFKDAVKNRRTIYSLTKKSSVSDERIKEIVTQAIHDVPSSFNSQSARLVVLFKEEHDKFWDVVTTILKAHVPEAKWEHTGQRMDMFKGAYGTILFYEDPEPIKALQSKFPNYADKFPQWSEHTSAMHQYELWTALEAEGLGANLQHYNPLPDQKASEIWNVPLEWSLKAQLVFGDPAEGSREKLAEKTQEPIEKRVFFHGA
ncbi:Fatty acid repression mutant protein 2 [Pseudocercospora fuligena]|uniref:Fatty acid repression mutant protein 2 n=1 Tax=Pseudocercospora fuligena TaxID=685502 RepID=A0A8H6VDL8_9PEZI|nr:Fatty acid repression mutant protein 2 [Pseudocercospora fuligena]